MMFVKHITHGVVTRYSTTWTWWTCLNFCTFCTASSTHLLSFLNVSIDMTRREVTQHHSWKREVKSKFWLEVLFYSIFAKVHWSTQISFCFWLLYEIVSYNVECTLAMSMCETWEWHAMYYFSSHLSYILTLSIVSNDIYFKAKPGYALDSGVGEGDDIISQQWWALARLPFLSEEVTSWTKSPFP